MPLQPAIEGEDATIPGTEHLDRTVLRTCILTAVTMIVLGGGQLLGLAQRGKSVSLVTLPKLDSNSVANTFVRMSSIALPIYAALKVGVFIVAFAFSFVIASGMPAMAQGLDTQSSRERLGQKKLTIGVIAAVVVSSFWGINTLWDAATVLGYVSLLVSIFVIRPPFSSLTLDSTHDPASQQKLAIADSPGTSSRDSILTALSGLLLAVGTVAVGGLSFQALDLAYVVATAGGFATCLIYAAPANLRSPHKIGLAIATGGAALLCAPPSHDSVCAVYAFRGILTGVAILASRFEDRHLRLATQAHNHHHHHHHHHAHSSDDASSLTKLIIRYSEPYPLLYSILKESDSRRIFYFMR
jgi:zinc transporter 5/7